MLLKNFAKLERVLLDRPKIDLICQGLKTYDKTVLKSILSVFKSTFPHKQLLKEIRNKNFNEGFTLLEMIVSIGIFSVLIVASIGIILSISNAQVKAANVQNIQDNIRFTLELITKELRVGSGYSVSSCTGNFCGQINFTTANGESRGYCFESGVIKRLTATTVCGFGSPMTSSNVVIDRLYFITSGTVVGGSDGQPVVTVVLEAHSADPRQALESKINAQTTVVQRLRDI